MLVVAVLASGLWAWRGHVIKRQTNLAATALRNGVAAGDLVAARSALLGFADPALRAAKEREVRAAELQQALSVRDTGLLRLALGHDDASWIDPQTRESADLMLAREAVQNRDFTIYQTLRDKWQAKSSFPGQWTLLEADQLLARKLPEDALQFLKAAQLSGAEDALRHARLALLQAKEPWKVMDTLDQGLKADPRNADVLSFRAQIEEAAGRIADARLDYVAAVLSERKNPLYRDILANFYLRYGNLPAAAETWRDAAEDTGLGVYALKSWFWSRMVGVPLSKPLPTSRQQGWRELTAALAATPADTFWSVSLDAALTRISGGQTRPEVAWLRLLENIRNGESKAARSQLETGFPRSAERLWPNLSLQLLTHLSARDGLDPRFPLAGRDAPTADPNAHPFELAFANWAKHLGTTDDLQHFETWIAQPSATTAILLATGWSGAALNVGGAAQFVPGPNSPDWFDSSYATALLRRDGKAAALTWLESLPIRSPEAELLLGQILLTSGKLDQGLATLQKIAASDSPLASRAAWTLALTELDRGDSAAARRITLANPALATSLQGKEILARSALAEGARSETLRIYQELGDQSVDAMIFLSKEAYAAGDFEQARQWTGKLARQFPEQPQFRTNLLQIDQAAKRPKP